MINFDLAALRTLVAIADQETFARAGDAVHRTQAAVSQQMRRLEDQLGLTLFERSGRTKELTPSGRKLVDYGRRMLALQEETLAALHAVSSSGPVRLGSPADIADTVLPEMLRQFARANPALSLVIHVGRSPDLMELLKKGAVDLTISTRLDDSRPHFLLRSSPIVWIAANDFRVEPGKPLPLVLADEPSIFRKIALDALERIGQPWHERYTAPGLAGIRAAVAAGLGITARSIEALTPDLRVVGEADGLPPLGSIRYYLYQRDEAVPEAAKNLYRLMAARG